MKLLDFEVEIGERTQIGGLSVFPLIGGQFRAPAYLTGPEAFEAGLLEVNELDPPEVPKLAVTNLSDLPVLLVEGEMLVGGDQNRTMNVTVLCPPRTRTVVPVSCVEAGRWGARRTMSGKRKHAPGSLRAAKTAYLESRSDDVGARGSDQGLVWEEVRRQSAGARRLLRHCRSRRRPGRGRGAHLGAAREPSSRSPTRSAWSAPSGTKWWGWTSSTARRR